MRFRLKCQESLIKSRNVSLGTFFEETGKFQGWLGPFDGSLWGRKKQVSVLVVDHGSGSGCAAQRALTL